MACSRGRHAAVPSPASSRPSICSTIQGTVSSTVGRRSCTHARSGEKKASESPFFNSDGAGRSVGFIDRIRWQMHHSLIGSIGALTTRSDLRRYVKLCTQLCVMIQHHERNDHLAIRSAAYLYKVLYGISVRV
eukprot:5398972-Pleurochrysis_carterae.AAC.1